MEHVIAVFPLGIGKAIKPVSPDYISFQITVEGFDIPVFFWCGEVSELLIDILLPQVATPRMSNKLTAIVITQTDPFAFVLLEDTTQQ